MALGVTWSLPQERHTYSKEYFEDTICKAMGGRVAEKIVFGHLNSGAANDLEQATGIARRMVREWGMSERVGPMAWQQPAAGVPRRGPDDAAVASTATTPPGCSTRRSRSILTEQEQRAHELLAEAPARPRPDRRGAARARDDRRQRGGGAGPGRPRRLARRCRRSAGRRSAERAELPQLIGLTGRIAAGRDGHVSGRARRTAVRGVSPARAPRRPRPTDRSRSTRPRNEARTTPAASANTVVGTASMR